MPFPKTSMEHFMGLRLELNRKTLWVYVLAIVFAGSLHAQDIRRAAGNNHFATGQTGAHGLEGHTR
jgi:hypothetical protein